ncbi:RNase P subunit p30 [Saccharolobus caldissimus]|uniref:RNase P p30-like protein n=1 Tax=Saccharolobus caldissimus TaxID=1702097 RepID=A0AAQ4CPE6_9CREN|nr:RNase P subunit p30 [Saccharolobus caldissimus]BDB97677.1 RNase P p30-like protein [Saccharolobus caldissimus]
MLVIESCILNSNLFPYAKKIGYNLVFSEDGLVGIKRVTFSVENGNHLKKILKGISREHILVFVKPLSIDSLKYAIINKRVNAIVLDDENSKIFRKTMLNLIRTHNKFVEVPLKSSKALIYKAILFSYKWIPNVIFSSYAKNFNELWNPISKISYLTILGADEEEAYKFVILNPIRLLYEFNSINN